MHDSNLGVAVEGARAADAEHLLVPARSKSASGRSGAADAAFSQRPTLVELLAADPLNPPLAAGEVVTTGTLTPAFPVAAGEVWTTELTSIPLEGARIRFT